MKTANEIVNLFEMVRNCSDQDWIYNKQRLIEIILDHDQLIIHRAEFDGLGSSVPNKKELKRINKGENIFVMGSIINDQPTIEQ